MTRRNAPLTPEGRRRACLEIDHGHPICHVPGEFRMARQTLGKWHARWLEFGQEGLEDRSSRPDSSPNQTPVEIEDLIESLRREHKIGPVQLAGKLCEAGHEVPVSTIHRVLVHRGINHLRDIAPDGQDLREPVRHYEWARPGDMVHVDVKKVGRIPDGGGRPEALQETIQAWQNGGFAAAEEVFNKWLPTANFEAQPGIALALRKEAFRRRGIFTEAAVRPPAASMPPELQSIMDAHFSVTDALVS